MVFQVQDTLALAVPRAPLDPLDPLAPLALLDHLDLLALSSHPQNSFHYYRVSHFNST